MKKYMCNPHSVHTFQGSQNNTGLLNILNDTDTRQYFIVTRHNKERSEGYLDPRKILDVSGSNNELIFFTLNKSCTYRYNLGSIDNPPTAYISQLLPLCVPKRSKGSTILFNDKDFPVTIQAMYGKFITTIELLPKKVEELPYVSDLIQFRIVTDAFDCSMPFVGSMQYPLLKVSDILDLEKNCKLRIEPFSELYSHRVYKRTW